MKPISNTQIMSQIVDDLSFSNCIDDANFYVIVSYRFWLMIVNIFDCFVLYSTVINSKIFIRSFSIFIGMLSELCLIGFCLFLINFMFLFFSFVVIRACRLLFIIFGLLVILCLYLSY